jgi:hypothetical protein
MKRIEFEEIILSNLPLPKVGFKTLGIDENGVPSTIDSDGNVEPIGGGESTAVDYKILFTTFDSIEETFDIATTLSSISLSTSIVSITLSKNGETAVTPTFPYIISINDTITYNIVYDDGKDKGSIIIKGNKII